MKPRQITIFTAIAVTTIVFTVMVIVSGVGLFNNNSENGIQSPNMGMPFNSDSNFLEKYDSGNRIMEEISLDISVSKNNDVSGAEIASEFCVDTKPGVMLVDYQIPDTLPLCITEEYLDSNLNITVFSFGGYHPDDEGMQALAIMQPKTDLGGCVEIDWVYRGSFICQDPALVCYGCRVEMWTADFELTDPIQVDSNHLPNVITLGADWSTLCDGYPSDYLGKWVYLGFISSWEGCPRYDQKFQLILAQKSYFSEIAPLLT